MSAARTVIATCPVCGYAIVAGLGGDDPQRIVRSGPTSAEHPGGMPHHAKCVGGIPFVSDADHALWVREDLGG